jgi:NAD kinase
VKKIGIVVKADQEARKKAEELEKWLGSRNVDIIKKESSPPNRGKSEIEGSRAPVDLYCVFVLGGDGTFLSAIRWIGSHDIPILGVKFGDGRSPVWGSRNDIERNICHPGPNAIAGQCDPQRKTTGS